MAICCAVDSLDLRVAQGTVYGLLGRNGAGKSTAIKMLLGMAHPSYGQAELFGEDAARLRPETRGESLTWPRGIRSIAG